MTTAEFVRLTPVKQAEASVKYTPTENLVTAYQTLQKHPAHNIEKETWREFIHESAKNETGMTAQQKVIHRAKRNELEAISDKARAEAKKVNTLMDNIKQELHRRGRDTKGQDITNSRGYYRLREIRTR